MKAKTADLTDSALDWAAAKAQNMVFKPVAGAGSIWFKHGIWTQPGPGGGQTPYVLRKELKHWVEQCDGGVLRQYTYVWEPSVNGAQGGPLIAEAKMDFAHYKRFRADGVKEHVYLARHQPVFTFRNYSSEMAAPIEAEGLTHLVAACRCYVLWKLGDEADIPEELL